MSQKLFKSGYIKVDPSQEIDLEPIELENEARGVIHGTVKNAEDKVCVAKLFKMKKVDYKNYLLSPIAFQYLDNWGQFLFPIVDTDCNYYYIVKIFCLDPEECTVDPVLGNSSE